MDVRWNSTVWIYHKCAKAILYLSGALLNHQVPVKFSSAPPNICHQLVHSH